METYTQPDGLTITSKAKSDMTANDVFPEGDGPGSKKLRELFYNITNDPGLGKLTRPVENNKSLRAINIKYGCNNYIIEYEYDKNETTVTVLTFTQQPEYIKN